MVMKYLFTFIFAGLLNTALAQSRPSGFYAALISQACKEMTDGGCIISTTCLLDFKGDSVTVTYQYNADCTPKTKEAAYEQLNGRPGTTYRWKTKKNTIVIDGFKDYGALAISDDNLVGKIERNTTVPLVFEPVKW